MDIKVTFSKEQAELVYQALAASLPKLPMALDIRKLLQEAVEDAKSEPPVPIMKALVQDIAESLCEDEGCPHHGTDHTCLGLKEANELLRKENASNALLIRDLRKELDERRWGRKR